MSREAEEFSDEATRFRIRTIDSRDDLSNNTEAKQAATNAIMQTLRNNDVDVTVLKDGAEMPDEARRQEVIKRVDALKKAADTIKGWVAGNKRNKYFTIELPQSTQRLVKKAMGRDFDSHNITANGIAHALKNHGENSEKLNKKSIAIRKEDTELMPYIMTAPDYVIKGSDDMGRESVRFYKTLSNGYVVVVEKEQKNSPDDMDTITMWAEKSTDVIDARNNTSPMYHAQDVIIGTDATKIKKDAEMAIKNDVKIQKQSVFHGSGNDFDAFDFSHMGEGEGAQAYGWGGYVTEVKGIGRAYAKASHSMRPSVLSELDFRQARIKEQLPFVSGDVKTEMEKELKDIAKKIADEKEKVHSRNLYTVSIPDNDGKNYLSLNERVGEERANIIGIYLERLGFEKTDSEIPTFENGGKKAVINPKAKGQDVYAELSETFGSDKEASRILNEAGFVGIEYPAQYTSGGRTDAAKNYVIFNEKDMKITDHIRFLKDDKGTVYGYTVGGKIYLSLKGLNPNTPIHEYTHLWTNAMMKQNPKEWNNIKNLLKGTPIWDEVLNDDNYSDIKDNEDDVASEVLSRISGRENSKRVIDRMQKAIDEAKAKGDAMSMAKASDYLIRIKDAINRFWNWVVTDLFHIHFKSTDEVVTVCCMTWWRVQNWMPKMKQMKL